MSEDARGPSGLPGAATRSTKMFEESAQAPSVVAALLEANRARAIHIGEKLRGLNPHAVVTGARGSSDNAATYAKYLIETKTSTLTSSAGLSTISVYTAQPKLDGTLFLAVSQSGKSPDLLTATAAARNAGAFVVAIVNDETAPLASLAHEVLPLHAGAEHSVAATKTYIASIAAIAQLVSAWSEDRELDTALSVLPQSLAQSWELDWSSAIERLIGVRGLYVIGRGLGFGTAQEAALKLKETCGLHAEAISSAEVRHGPMALVKDGFPVLIFSQDDETRIGIGELTANFAKSRASLVLAGISYPDACNLPTLAAHPVLQPVLMAQSFYRMANALSLARGHNPDKPPHLNKITETV
jgi:glutamine---fructose-6-phosphate transaminase (isomerizing)